MSCETPLSLQGTHTAGWMNTSHGGFTPTSVNTTFTQTLCALKKTFNPRLSHSSHEVTAVVHTGDSTRQTAGGKYSNFSFFIQTLRKPLSHHQYTNPGVNVFTHQSEGGIKMRITAHIYQTPKSSIKVLLTNWKRDYLTFPEQRPLWSQVTLME